MVLQSSKDREAVRVTLDLFDGPLDLLLHLIHSQRIDIADVRIAEITERYLAALDLFKESDLTIAGEYLVMAATLILIKSRSLLPQTTVSSLGFSDEDDPKEALIQRLKQYQLYREAGRFLGELETLRSRRFVRGGVSEKKITEWVTDATITDIFRALNQVVKRRNALRAHVIYPNPISIRDRMTALITFFTQTDVVMLNELFRECSSKYEAIVTFLAILELIRTNYLQVRQRRLFGDIRLTRIPRQDPDGNG